MRAAAAAAAVAVLWLTVPGPVRAAAPGRHYEIDLVITSKMRSAPEHLAVYLEKIRKEVAAPFRDLCAPGGTGPEKPPDGAAGFRLLVTHDGVCQVSGAVKRPKGTSGQMIYVEIPTHQEGTVRFDLLKWTGQAYENVDAWTVPFRQDRSHSGSTAGDLASAKAQADLRRAALMSMTPPDFGDALLARLMPVQLAVPKTVVSSLPVTVQNRFPWPVRRLLINADWSQVIRGKLHSVSASVDYSGLLMPGKGETVEASVRVGEPRERVGPPDPVHLIVQPTLEPDRGPVWVGRLAADIAGTDVGARQEAVAKIGAQLDTLTPDELAPAVLALIDALKHEAPASEADLSLDARNALVRVGAPAVPRLVEALKDANPGKRLGAVAVLRDMKTPAKAALAALKEVAANDQAEAVRQAAAQAAEVLGAAADGK